jgi:acyl-CoA thioester hydrolase
MIIYRTAVAPQWIDYNGHLRDAYYALIISYATDAMMDLLGMDAAYRERTGCTLYTVEMHMHFLREVRQTDTLTVTLRLIGADHKRLHVALELRVEGQTDAAASAELMLLHVQQGATSAAASFEAPIRSAIDALEQASAALPAKAPGSRQMQLRPR